MKPALAALALWLPLLAGCAAPRASPEAGAARPAGTDKAGAVAEPSGRRRPTSPVYTVPRSAPPRPDEVSSAAPAPEPPARPASDTCAATELAYLVGKPRTEIPVPADLTHRRVVCTGCPVTQDVRPDRQTITYDPATNLVSQVACG